MAGRDPKPGCGGDRGGGTVATAVAAAVAGRWRVGGGGGTPWRWGGYRFVSNRTPGAVNLVFLLRSVLPIVRPASVRFLFGIFSVAYVVSSLGAPCKRRVVFQSIPI